MTDVDHTTYRFTIWTGDDVRREFHGRGESATEILAARLDGLKLTRSCVIVALPVEGPGGPTAFLVRGGSVTEVTE